MRARLQLGQVIVGLIKETRASQLKFTFTVMPDYAQVYSFIGSVFDPNSTKHLQRLKQMDPTDVEMVTNLKPFIFIASTSFLSLSGVEVQCLEGGAIVYGFSSWLVLPELVTSSFLQRSEYVIIAPIKLRIYLTGLVLVDLVIWSLIFPGDLKMNASCVMRLTTVDLVICCP